MLKDSMIRQIKSEKVLYFATGSFNTFAGYAIFYLLWNFLGQSIHYLVICFVTHVVAVTTAFFSYRFFVFNKAPVSFLNFFKFNLVYFCSFIANMIALPILVEFFNIHALVAQAFILSLTVIVTYFAHKRFSFGTR